MGFGYRVQGSGFTVDPMGRPALPAEQSFAGQIPLYIHIHIYVYMYSIYIYSIYRVYIEYIYTYIHLYIYICVYILGFKI